MKTVETATIGSLYIRSKDCSLRADTDLLPWRNKKCKLLPVLGFIFLIFSREWSE